MRVRITVTLLFLLWTIGFGRVSAQTAGDSNLDTTLSPYFLIPGGEDGVDRLPLLETAVEVRIAGVIADVRVRQIYENDGARPIHATYVFPASTRAAVHGLTLTFGDEVVRAQIREREQARKEFEQAKREHKTATLLEQQRPNVFRMSVANVMPQDRLEVELHYSELLVPEEGVYEFVYPTVVGPRYGARSDDAGEPEPRFTETTRGEIRDEALPLQRLRLEVHVAAGLPIDELGSPSHEILTRWSNSAEVELALDPGDPAAGNRDFVLRYRLSGGQVQAGLLLFDGAAAGRDENFFLLMVQPPRRVLPEDVPGREYVFVVDVSGSMSGFPLDTTKHLLRTLIGELRPTDTFNLLFFSGGSAVLSPHSLPPSAANVESALRMIDGQRGEGVTELLPAVRRAMALPAAQGVSRSFVIVTDGYINAEREVFTYIREQLNGANFFCFGIGSSVNRYLVEGIAKAGLGEPFVVLDPSEAPAIAKRFHDYVRAPVLTDVSVEFDGFDVYDVEPKSFPDVLAERPVILQGKWRGRPAGWVVVRGVSGEGSFEQAFDVSQVEPDPANAGLAYLWAKTRVADLSDFSFGQVSEEDRRELIGLGLKYDLLTRYTSFIAVREMVRPVVETPADVQQPLPLPQGVSHIAVGDEPPLWVVLLGLVLAVAAWQRWLGWART